MVTDRQRRVIWLEAIREVCALSGEPSTQYEHGAVKRLAAFGVRILEAAQPDSWGMSAVEDGDD